MVKTLFTDAVYGHDATSPTSRRRSSETRSPSKVLETVLIFLNTCKGKCLPKKINVIGVWAPSLRGEGQPAGGRNKHEITIKVSVPQGLAIWREGQLFRASTTTCHARQTEEPRALGAGPASSSLGKAPLSGCL